MAYLNVQEVESAVINLSVNYPATSTLINLPETSVEGRTIHALRIGVAGGKPTALFIGCVHAREWGSADILVNFAADVLEAYDTNSGITYGGKSFSAADIKNIVQNMNVIVLPDANPDGKKYSQESEAMWRKNRNPANNGGNPDCTGVDINRNYDFLWNFPTVFSPSSGVSASTSPCDDVYHGPSPFSEPETRNVRWLMDNYPVQWFIDVHSYSQDFLYIWGDDDNQTSDPSKNFQNPAYNNVRGVDTFSPQAGTPQETAYREYIDAADQSMHASIANTTKSAIFDVRGKNYTTGQSITLYPVSGGSEDYAYSRHIVDPSKLKILGFVIEWGTVFQPPWAEMENIIQDISAGLIAFCKTAPCPAGLITVTLSTPSIEFNDIPEGETTARAASFKINSCGGVSFTVTNGPALVNGVGSFSLPLGGNASLPASGNYYLDQTALLWVAYTGTNDGDSATGTIDIRCNETGQVFTIPIHANTIHRPSAAVELVLDKSNSMNFNSGFTLPYLDTRIKVLHYSAVPLADLIQENNGIGVCAFDQDPHPVMPVTVAGPLNFGAGRITAKNSILNHQPNPQGNTAIGDGVVQGMSDLGAPAATGFDVKAMIVLTDGFDTAHLTVDEVTGTLNNAHVFAIGLGTGDDIKPAALNALTNSTGGYLLLTGHMNNDDQFLLSKYYLQILAGITNTDIVLDPEGVLHPGDKHIIPVNLNEGDISCDMVLLSPAPSLIDFTLQTPTGDIINPGMSGTVPGVQFAMSSNNAAYRISLPVPVSSGGAGAGQWKVILKLRNREGHLKSFAQYESLRYSLNAYSFSNVKMIARVDQNSFQPGAIATVRAVLTQYGLPLENITTISATIKNPDNTSYTQLMKKVGAGIFEYTFRTDMTGVYKIRVEARGNTLRGLDFTREQLLTAVVYKGGDQPVPPIGPDGGNQGWCEFLKCLIKHKVFSPEFLNKLEHDGINLLAMEKCCHQESIPPR